MWSHGVEWDCRIIHASESISAIISERRWIYSNHSLQISSIQSLLVVSTVNKRILLTSEDVYWIQAQSERNGSQIRV